jgi:hypothetical protein
VPFVIFVLLGVRRNALRTNCTPSKSSVLSIRVCKRSDSISKTIMNYLLYWNDLDRHGWMAHAWMTRRMYLNPSK